MSEQAAESDAQRREHAAFIAECEAKGLCWASGLRIASCMASICDCFRETHPDSPYDLHPEDFVVSIEKNAPLWCYCPEISADDIAGPEPHTCSTCGYTIKPTGEGV